MSLIDLIVPFLHQKCQSIPLLHAYKLSGCRGVALGKYILKLPPTKNWRAIVDDLMLQSMLCCNRILLFRGGDSLLAGAVGK